MFIDVQLIGGYVVADSGSLFSGFKKTPLTMQSYRMSISQLIGLINNGLLKQIPVGVLSGSFSLLIKRFQAKVINFNPPEIIRKL